MEVVEESIGALLMLGEQRSLNINDMLFNANDRSDGFYIVLSGVLMSFSFDPILMTKKNMLTHRRFALIGVKSVPHEHRDCTVQAIDQSMVLHIHEDTAEALLNGQHPLSPLLYKLMRYAIGHRVSGWESGTHHDQQSPIVDQIFCRAVDAQHQLCLIEEALLDELIVDIADAVNKQAWRLAEAAINETGMGHVPHRVQKIMLGTLEVAASLRGQPGAGQLQVEAQGIESIAMPMGVVLGLIPITNPVETLVFKALIALKSRNALIVSSHRDAIVVSREVMAIMHTVIESYGLPSSIVQLPDLPPSRQLTQMMMSHRQLDFILATGGESVVKAAYQSGTPSIGVGKGNAPVWVCSDADVEQAAQHIVSSKAFDNGVVCGSENNLLVDRVVSTAFQQALVSQGAAILSEQEVSRLSRLLWMNNSFNRVWLGKRAADIAKAADIVRNYPIELLVCPVDRETLNGYLTREKLAPIVSYIEVNNDAEAFFVARSVLNIEGRGHTAIIHSKDQARIHAYSQVVDVSRVLVNSPGTQGCIGACNGLALSWTLGCGTAGGSSTSDNVTYRHLMNTKRVAYRA